MTLHTTTPPQTKLCTIFVGQCKIIRYETLFLDNPRQSYTNNNNNNQNNISDNTNRIWTKLNNRFLWSTTATMRARKRTKNKDNKKNKIDNKKDEKSQDKCCPQKVVNQFYDPNWLEQHVLHWSTETSHHKLSYCTAKNSNDFGLTSL